MFNRQWFQKHQRILLWFANTWFGRRILCINGDRSSVGKNKIIGIMPNAIFWAGKKKGYHFIKGKKVNRPEYVAEFRTHAKYSKRLFYAFKPIWYLFHFWDTLVANTFRPSWNLGFDTLTAYPDAGDPATTAIDGDIYRGAVDETWATIQAGAGSATENISASATFAWMSSNATSGHYDYLKRGFFLFDTSLLTNQATISAAVPSIFGSSKNSALGGSGVDIVASNPASNTTLAATDFVNIGTTVFATKTNADYSTAAYNDFTLDANGIANINKTGVSKFGARLSWDTTGTFGGVWASNADDGFGGYFADQTGTTNDPKLVVTYFLGNEEIYSGQRVPIQQLKFHNTKKTMAY